MLAFASVWIGLCSLLIAVAMGVYRPVFTDLGVVIVLWLASPLSICLGGIVLWAHRHQPTDDPALQSQRLQCKVGMALAIIAAVVVYCLIIYSVKLEPIEGDASNSYNAAKLVSSTGTVRNHECLVKRRTQGVA